MTKIIYRTQDGQDYFAFDVVRLVDESLRAYIAASPSYGSRSTDGHSTHRYIDEDSSRYYICFDQVIYTMEDMKVVMKYWAEETQSYIATGVFRQPEELRRQT